MIKVVKTAILSWVQNDGSRGFSVDQLKENNFDNISTRCFRTKEDEFSPEDD